MKPANYQFLNRDLSWLSFNHRVLLEATDKTVPLYSRISFLSIFSSNLDEFFRVRMPAIFAFTSIDAKKTTLREEYPKDLVQTVQATVLKQQEEFGRILGKSVIPALARLGFHFLYKEPISEQIAAFARHYFYTQIAGFLQPVYLNDKTSFFPENNQIYIVVVLELPGDKEKIALVNTPVPQLDRFVKIKQPDGEYIIFLEDLIRCNLPILFPDALDIKALFLSNT